MSITENMARGLAVAFLDACSDADRLQVNNWSSGIAAAARAAYIDKCLHEVFDREQAAYMAGRSTDSAYLAVVECLGIWTHADPSVPEKTDGEVPF